jgi:GNAT superfamily N-acetyltransferase
VVVNPVQGSKELRAFLQVPFSLQGENPCWVPPLWVDRLAFFDRQKNPFYKTADVELFLAYRGGHAVGRIAACVNHDFNATHTTKTGSFGFFESPDDLEVASALLEAAGAWLRERGMTDALGPLNFSSNHEIGFLADAYDLPPVLMMTYNPPYYLDLVEGCGWTKAKDLWAFKLSGIVPPPERIRRISEKVRERTRVKIRTLDKKRFAAEIDSVREVYNQAWSRNWGFVPLREEEFNHIAADLKLILRPEWALVAEVDGRPIGFSLTLPNVYRSQINLRNGRLLPTGLFRLLWDIKFRRPSTARVITMGVIPEYQKRGIESIFYIETFDRTSRDGIQWGELSWVLEDNDMMVRAAEALGAARYKTYRVYGKRLGSDPVY